MVSAESVNGTGFAAKRALRAWRRRTRGAEGKKAVAPFPFLTQKL